MKRIMKNGYLIFDSHLDLSMNAMEWNRDLRWPLEKIRESERGMTDKPDSEKGTVSFPSMREGGVRLCVATQIARYVKPGNPILGWHSSEQAWAQTQAQLSWYRAMEEAGEMVQICDRSQMEAHLTLWENPSETLPIGYILSLEGADSLYDMRRLEIAYEYGLRAIGPAHYGPGTYAQGTDAVGGIGAKGRELLKEMDSLGMILDASHLSEDSFREALEVFHGPVWASHNDCRVFAPHNRQFSDEQIDILVQRGAVIGVALDAWMLVPGWDRELHTPESRGVNLNMVANNIDHICQLTGNSFHVGIGSDLDGAYGTEQSPYDLNSIADLQKIAQILAGRGYKEEDIGRIMSGNFIRFLRNAWK